MRDPGARLVRSAIDGVDRRADHEMVLNKMAASLFSAGGGRDFIDYLRSITIQRIHGPDATDGQIRHLEGARWLYGVIQARISAGRRDPGGARSIPGPEQHEGEQE